MLINFICASGIGACEAVSVTVPERDPLETWAFRLTHKILENANRVTTRRIIELRYSDREKPIPDREFTFPDQEKPIPWQQANGSWHVIEHHEMRLFDDVVVWPVRYGLHMLARVQ